MTPITLVFHCGTTLTVYSEIPDAFAKTVAEASPPEIKSMEYDRDTETEADVPDLQEVSMLLDSGSLLLCQIATSEIPKAEFIDGITYCKPSTLLEYAKMAKDEKAIDDRYASVTTVINNIPDLEVRKHLHIEYIKRKRAYVAALEALIDGTLRRPDE